MTVAQPQPFAQEIWSRPSPDGTDYWRVCLRHEWVSLDAPDVRCLSPCPLCLAELDSGHWRARFHRLMCVGF